MSFPYTKGWQLSREREPAVVARTCPLPYLWANCRNVRQNYVQHQRWLDLFCHACQIDVIPGLMSGEHTMPGTLVEVRLAGVTEVNMQGWLPSSSSNTESYQPTPKPSPLIGLRRSTRNRESKAWLMIEWHGRVRSYQVAQWANEIRDEMMDQHEIVGQAKYPCISQSDTFNSFQRVEGRPELVEDEMKNA